MSVNEPTMTRGQKIWGALRDLRDKQPISIERAILVTRSYKESEGLPLYIRRGMAFEKVVSEIPIHIDDEQLLVGDFSSRPMAPELFPELTVQWVEDYLEKGGNEYAFEPGKEAQLREICDYWHQRSGRETFYRMLGTEEVSRLYRLNEEGAWIYAASTEAQTEKGWNIPDYKRGLELGTSGLVAKIDEKLAALHVKTDEDFKKKTFYLGLKQMLNAGVVYAHRYADLCERLAEDADGRRKDELLNMASICRRVPEFPARTFQEAVQSVFFFHLLIYWDTRTVGLGFGRVDQYLYPYYQRDIESGLIDKEYATQILECFRVKMCSKRNLFNPTVTAAVSSDSHFHNCTLGGQTAEGRDAVNPLSYLWLDAAERVRTPHPTLSIRWHPNIDPKFVLRGIEIVKLGMGFPAWFNDEPTIEYLLARGVTLAEARNYAIGGCVLHNVVGATPTTWPSVMNFAKIFELAMNDGADPRMGLQFGPHTGSLETLDTYDKLLSAFYRQVAHFVQDSVEYLNLVSTYRGEVFPEIMASCLFDDCIEKGKTILSGGAKYPINCQYVIPVGVVDVANSLYAMKKCVYEGRHSLKEMGAALAADFNGYDDLYRDVMACPKFGNDVAEVDDIVADIYTWACDYIQKIPGDYGCHYEVAPHSIAFHANMGLKTGALPSGRKAKVSLADGAVSPCQGTDECGPAAVIRSAGRIDHTNIFGTLFNMKFTPSSLSKPSDLGKLASLIETYFKDYGGKHIQFNIVDRETLLDAYEHPEKHRDLIVRVAGYSALWVELNDAIHRELIGRTANSF